MRKFDVIFWDLDGTLLDFLLSERYALRVCLAAHGVEMTEEMLAIYSKINEGYWKRLEKGEVTKKELLPGRFRDFFAEMGITHIDPVALQERYQIELGTETYYIDESYELLCKLKKQGFRQYIVTNGVIATQEVKMRNSGFDKIVDGIFISDEIGFEKPRKEYFDKAFAMIPDFDIERAILIGDSPSSDIKGANNAGVTACWYNPKGKQLPEGVHTEYEIKSLYELDEILGMGPVDYNAIYKPERDVKVIKKDGSKTSFQVSKVLDATAKSAGRVMVTFTEAEKEQICRLVIEKVNSFQRDELQIQDMHHVVEYALEHTQPVVAKSYRDYRNYKQDFVRMLDDVYKKSQAILYIGDRENANTDSALVSTRRSLTFNQLNKGMYQKFFLTQEEIQAGKDGYIYIHDMSARRDTMNCCLFDIGNVLKGGFEMGSVWYNEPKYLDTAFDVCGDIILFAASQQYGGFTIPEVDKLMAPYAERTYHKYLEKYKNLGISEDAADRQAYADVCKEMEQGFQGWEYKFNTVASSRGDYPFITVTAGLGKERFEKLASITLLNVRKGGQGKKGHKKPVLFPKIVFLYDENLHGPGCELEDVFEAGIQCSAKAMYPDWLSLTGEGYVASIYKKYGKVISPMGCRAFLSPWYERGGMKPADEQDVPVFTGRFNIGVVSLHLPMILAKAREEQRDFYEVLDYYLEMIRRLHLRTYEYLGEMTASNNPLAYCEGGFYGGKLGFHDKIAPLLKSATASFGITALNELQVLYNGKSLVEDGAFALEVMHYINEKIEQYKKEDGKLYAIYGTPAENLCGLQVTQFKEKYGVIPGVSDRAYVSNSFHCHVAEQISPIQKQDLEKRFWDDFNGGKIQYVKYPIDYNYDAIRTLVRRAMKLGFYEGVNLSLSYCDDCGYEQLEMDTCPKCGSRNLTKIDRMNGYLAYSRVHGATRLSDAKMEEIAERVSM